MQIQVPIRLDVLTRALRRSRLRVAALATLPLISMALLAADADMAGGPAPAGVSQVADGLIGHWPMNEAAGTTAFDVAGANPGALMDGAAWGDGRFGGGIRLDGPAHVAPAAMDVYGTSLTLAAWIHVANYPASMEQRIISKSTGTAEQQHLWMLGQTRVKNRNLLQFRLKTGKKTTTMVASTGELPTSAWYHAAATYDGATMRLYLNGKEVGRTAASGTIAIDPEVPVNFGRSPDGSNFLRGSIDDVRIYNRALTEADLAAIMEDAGDAQADTNAPTPPTALQATAASPTQIHLQWIVSTDDTGVVGYRVHRNGIPAGTTEAATYADAGLLASTAYSYTVSALDAAGNESAPSMPAVATTLASDTKAPLISNVTAGAITDVGGTVSWTTDEPANSVLDYGTTTAYGTSVAQHILGTSHAIQLSALQPSTTYHYRVTSADAAGNASRSADLTFTTAPSTTPPDTDPIAHWPLDDGSGTRAIDASGGVIAVLAGGATWTVGRGGYAVSFDGSTSHLDLPAIDVTGSALTIAAWVRHGAFPPGVDQRVISKSTSANEDDQYWMLSQVDADGRSRLRFSLKTDGVTTTLIATAGDLAPNTWYHAAATYDGAAMRLYLNGMEVGHASKSGPIATSAAVPVNVGRNPGGMHPLTGSLDDLRLYSRALTPADIASVMEDAGEPAPDTQAPSVPMDLQATAASSTEIHLRWTASIDDVGVTAYRVRRNGIVIAATPTTTYADAGLAPATAYGYTVTALDAAGNESADSVPVAESTKPGETANQPPDVVLTSPASGTSYAEPASIALTAAASDPENRLTDVQFYAGGTLLATDTAAPYAFTWTSVPAGSYSLTAIARDADGGFTASAPVTVTVAAPLVSPWFVGFTASTEHDTSVISYLLEIFTAGADPNVATPLHASDLGKPAPDANREIIVDRTALIGSLAPGSYVITVSALSSGAKGRSAPLAFTR